MVYVVMSERYVPQTVLESDAVSGNDDSGCSEGKKVERHGTLTELKVLLEQKVADGYCPILTISGGCPCLEFSRKGKLDERTRTLSNAHHSQAYAAVDTCPDALFFVPFERFLPADVVAKMNKMAVLGSLAQNMPLARRLLENPEISDAIRNRGINIGKMLEPTLCYLFEDISKDVPIGVFHYELIRFFADRGNPVLAAITDRCYVHEGYAEWADYLDVHFAGFADNVKYLLPLSARDRYHTVGAFIPQKLVKYRKAVLNGTANEQFPWAGTTSDYLLCSGGVGTNILEIVRILQRLLPFARDNGKKVKVFLGTNVEFAGMFARIFKRYTAGGSKVLTILSDPDIRKATAMLSDATIGCSGPIWTKPSGDILEAVLAVCKVPLMLQPNQHHEVLMRRWVLEHQFGFCADIGNTVNQVLGLYSGGGMSRIFHRLGWANLNVDGGAKFGDVLNSLRASQQ